MLHHRPRTLHASFLRGARLTAAGSLLAVACQVADEPRELAPRFAQVEIVDTDVQATVVAHDADEREVSRALLVRDHEVARFEIELDGDRFLAELDPVAGELTLHGEADGSSVSWSPGSGEPMPEVFAGRWAEINAAWRAALLDGEGRLRDEFRGALNVPADLFAGPEADVPVSTTFWCPPPQQICFYDEASAQEICIMLAQMWCPPPPPPCWGFDCDPCMGLRCSPPCWGGACPEPCIGLWCDSDCSPYDVYCAG
jgi:hypothetical protein